MDKLICLGKNYLDHAHELGDAVPEKPVVFFKPPSILRTARKMGERLLLQIPKGSSDLHHECEIVGKISQDLYQCTVEEAEAAVTEYTLGLDMTLRTLQSELKSKGHPWERSKIFLDSAVIGPWVKKKDFPQPMNTSFSFKLDGLLKQEGNPQHMRIKIAEALSEISQTIPIKSGDLIFTGTPAGVGPVSADQVGELQWGPVQFSVKWIPALSG
jgi:2-keto-4-pentenoate hydratase/2-oxohepta-3-ene-1,7-dioic acid hydratase in catechol pathway